MEHLVGRSLGRYRLEVLLGEGGMGAVFRASDITLQRQVAVKVMHPHIARQPQFRDRFLQEARTAARLDHPGIVKVFDFGQDAGHLYIVMEFIPGENLRDLLKRLAAAGQAVGTRGIVLPEAVQLVRHVCLALEYAHKHGVLHRDIKPDNIMLKPGAVDGDELPYQPVLTDLGLAKLAEGGVMTAAGISMGTPAYMSPEQAMGQRTDARSDVYSLGILLFELAVGRLPFPASTLSEAIRYHAQEPPPRPRSLRPELPEHLEAVILQALAKNPDNRFRGAGALARALDGVLPQVRAAPRLEESSSLTHVISLATPAERERPPSRGPSIFEQFPDQPTDLAADRVVALLADGSLRRATIRPEGLTIGRGRGNDLVIDDGDVSRQHARVTFDGNVYQVTDQNSTNGTFLGDVRLLPGVSERWDPDTPLRMGRTWLRLEQAGLQVGRRSTPALGPDARAAPAWESGQATVPETAAYPASGATVPDSLAHLDAGTAAGTATVDMDDRRHRRFPVWVLPTAIVLFLGLAAGGAFLFWPRQQDEPTPAPTEVSRATDTPSSLDTTVPTGIPHNRETDVPTMGPTAALPTTPPVEPTTAVPVPITPTPTPTPSATPSATPTVSPTSTASATPTATDTRTPSVTPTPTCAQPVDSDLASAWDRSRLGCATAPASVIWAAWEPFERGYMLWRSDLDHIYAFFFQNGTNLTRGSYQTGGDAWKWDGSYPDGTGLTPPAGLLEPVRGFGYVWRNFLGGPSGDIGWATDEEKGFCVRIQPFEQGLMFRSDTVTYCEDEYYNWATHPSFVPLYFSLSGDGNWWRH